MTTPGRDRNPAEDDLGGVPRVYPHCRHCSWSHPAHVEVHHSACGCDECPYDFGNAEPDQPTLF